MGFQCLSELPIPMSVFYNHTHPSLLFPCLQSIISWTVRKHGNSDNLYGKKENSLFTQQTRFCLAFSCTPLDTSLVRSELKFPEGGSVPQPLSMYLWTGLYYGQVPYPSTPWEGLPVGPRAQHWAPSFKILGMSAPSSCPEPTQPTNVLFL